MVKQLKVDVSKSLGYQANGRLKKADEKETAKLSIKKFICPECHYEKAVSKKQFGENFLCPECKTVMIFQY